MASSSAVAVAAAALGLQASAIPATITDRTAALVFLAATKRGGPAASPAALAEEDALHWEAATVAAPAAALLATAASATPEAVAAFAAAAAQAVTRAAGSPLLAAVLAADVAPLLADAALGAALKAAAPALAPAVEAVTSQPWWKAATAGGAKPAAKKGKADEGGASSAAAAAAEGGDKPSKAQEKAAAKKAGKAAGGAPAAAASPLVIVDLPCPVPDAVTPAGVASPAGDALFAAPMAHTLDAVFLAAILAAFPAASEAGIRGADVQLNSNPSFAHQYQVNSALSLPGKLKGKPGAPANPRAAAEAVIAAYKAGPPCALVGKLEIAGPGYINVYLSGQYVAGRVAHTLARGVLPPPLPPGGAKSVVVDYSSPNIAKEMHIGHLRSTIIGDALARVLEFAGHTVARVNHVGDWGTQFGMLIAHLKDTLAIPADASTDDAAGRVQMNLTDLTGLYKAAKKRFDAEAGFKERAHAEVVALQGGSALNRALWTRMIDISASMFNEVYGRLGIDSRLALCGESFYNDKIPGMLEELATAADILGAPLLEADEGATVLRVPGFEVPLMVRKSDGGYGYDTTDLAALRYRLRTLKADWLVYVIDSGQALHMDLVFAGGVRAGWFTPAPGSNAAARTVADKLVASAAAAGAAAPSTAAPLVRVDHVGFGVVQGEDRKKFKTRDGSTVRLVDVLDEAKARAKAILAERVAAQQAAAAAAAGASSSSAAAPSDVDLDAVSATLGYGGVKYFDLRQNRNSDYIFNYDRMLSPDGDTATYMQYAHARLCSIQRKARDTLGGPAVDAILADTDPAGVLFGHASDLGLALAAARFQEVLTDVQGDLLPHRLCEFLFGLAGATSDFHRDCFVLHDSTPAPLRASRLRLVAAAAAVMRTALRLLGITALERI